jgi:CDP-glucose 4,6-dehydratase
MYIKIIKLFQSKFLNFSYKIVKDKKFLETKILQLSNAKFSQMFKWRPILNMSQTINFTIEWYKILIDSKIYNLKQITNSQIKFFLDVRSKRY